MERRVVVTGMGVLAPNGNNLDSFWEALVNGVSGIGPITRFDARDYSTRIAGEIKGFDPGDIISPQERRRMDIFSQYAICATEMAVKDSGLDVNREDPFRVGVIYGSGIGGLTSMHDQHLILETKGPHRVSPFFIPLMIVDIAAGHISMRYGAKGPNYATVSACASGSHAIGVAVDTIKCGDADVILTGGSESTISPMAFAGFGNMRAISRRNDEPEKASRPFDRDRDGFVLAEGAGSFVLEELERAKKRGAHIYAEILRAGFTGDAYHITAPEPDGNGAIRAMMDTIERAGVHPEDVDYINCHCPSTPAGDKAEVLAIKSVFGKYAYKVPVSSTKSMHGHLLGAAGPVELIATILAMRNGIIPPTINVENQDPECDLDCTPNKAREHKIDFALSNSFGFGGHNAVLAVRRFT